MRGCNDGTRIEIVSTPSSLCLDGHGHSTITGNVSSNLGASVGRGLPGPAWQISGYTVLQCDAGSGNPGFRERRSIRGHPV